MTRQGVAAIRRAAPPAPGSTRLSLVTAGSGAPADRAAFQGDAPSLEAGSISVDPDGVAGRPEPAPPTSLLSTAPLPGEIVSTSPSVGFAEARSQGGSPPGPSWGRETAVNNGQSRCPADNHNCSFTAVFGRGGAAGPYMACKRSHCDFALPLPGIVRPLELFESLFA